MNWKEEGLLYPKDPIITCVRSGCGHDTSWHHSPIADGSIGDGSIGDRIVIEWTEGEWKKWHKATWKDSPCQNNDCACKAFRHPEAPRRREAIEHTRRMG